MRKKRAGLEARGYGHRVVRIAPITVFPARYSLLATAATGTGVGLGLVLADAPGRAAPATSDEFRQPVGRAIFTALNPSIPQSLNPSVPWSFGPLVLLRPTRYSLPVAVASSSTSELSRSAREARYSDCRISSFVTRLACATARRMALSVPIRRGEWFGTDSR